MKVTINWLAREFDNFNHNIFKGELPTPVFETNNTSKTLGRCEWRRRGGITTYKIIVSNYYNRIEKSFKETLLHEMIHLYFFSKGNIKEGHGSEFKRMARYVNTFGFNVTAKTNPTYLNEQLDDEDNANYPIQGNKKCSTKKEYHILVFYKSNNKNVFITRITPNSFQHFAVLLHKLGYDVGLYKSTEQIFGAYHCCRKKLLYNTCLFTQLVEMVEKKMLY